MSERSMQLAALDDAGLESMLRASADSVAWPLASAPGAPDLAARVRARLVAAPPRAPRRAWSNWRPARRALILALLALLALAAIVGAVGLGLPGLRLTLGDAPVSPPPSVSPSAITPAPPGALGSRLGLGDAVALADVEVVTGLPVRLPADPAIGPPAAVYVDPTRNDQVAFVWAATDALPRTLEPGIGLVLMRFDGTTDDGYHQKLIGEGATARAVKVGGQDGFWISGAPHYFFYYRADGSIVDDTRRWVGDALIWSDGGTTYRLESALGMDRTIAIAESLE